MPLAYDIITPKAWYSGIDEEKHGLYKMSQKLEIVTRFIGYIITTHYDSGSNRIHLSAKNGNFQKTDNLSIAKTKTIEAVDIIRAALNSRHIEYYFHPMLFDLSKTPKNLGEKLQHIVEIEVLTPYDQNKMLKATVFLTNNEVLFAE